MIILLWLSEREHEHAEDVYRRPGNDEVIAEWSLAAKYAAMNIYIQIPFIECSSDRQTERKEE